MILENILNVIAGAFIVLGVCLFFDLTLDDLTGDVMDVLRPKTSLRSYAKSARAPKKKRTIYHRLTTIRTTLNATGNAIRFPVLMFAAAVMFCVGIMLGMLINNSYLAGVLAIIFPTIPFIIADQNVQIYEKQVTTELETALSIITSSYIRTENIVVSIRENVKQIKPPLRQVFQEFLGETSAISADIKAALNNMSKKVDNTVFVEWCEDLIQCQDDRTLKDALLPTVNRLGNIRVVNEELGGIIAPAKLEYFTMVGLLVMNVPLLYFMNKYWFDALWTTTAGKIDVAFSVAVVYVTALLLRKYCKPMKYKG